MGVKQYRDVPRIYLDMDGPLADFERVMIEKQLPGSKLKLMRGVYRDLPVVKGAKAAVAEMLLWPIDLWVLTKCPSENPYAASEKHEWAREHFAPLWKKIIITPDKGCVGRPCDVLIDDHPEWANANNFPGTMLKFEYKYDSYGGSTNNWDKILNVLRGFKWATKAS